MPATLLISLSVCGLVALLIGIGYIALHAFADDHSGRFQPVPGWYAWLGFGLLIILLQAWHILSPVNDVARIGLLMTGIAGFGQWLFRNMRGLKTVHILYLFAIGLAIILIGNQALRGNNDYDAGLYYHNAIQWSQEYPALTGLGHLHDRLAFNNAYYLFAALLDTGPWVERPYHVLTPTLLFMTILYLMPGLLALRQSAEQNSFNIVRALLLIPLPGRIFSTEIVTLSNDTAIFLLGIVCLCEIWRLLSQPEAQPSFVLIVVLIISGVAIKFSFAGLAVLGGVAGFLGLIFRARASQRAPFLILTCAALVLGALPQLIRSVIQTGYLLYPITQVGVLPLAWQLPAQQGRDAIIWIQAWARTPGVSPDTVLADWQWIEGWLRRAMDDRHGVVIPLVLALIAASWLSYQFVRKRRLPGQALTGIVIIACGISGLAYWFITAPDLRFAGASIWIISASLMTMALSIVHFRIRAILIGALLLFSLGLSLRNNVINAGSIWLPDHETTGVYPASSVHFDLETATTASGLVVYVPPGSRCGRSPLPCTPNFQPGLALRHTSDMASGFVLRRP